MTKFMMILRSLQIFIIIAYFHAKSKLRESCFMLHATCRRALDQWRAALPPYSILLQKTQADKMEREKRLGKGEHETLIAACMPKEQWETYEKFQCGCLGAKKEPRTARFDFFAVL